MKKFLSLIVIVVSISAAYAASSINIDYDDGIYHIVLSGDKIKKQVQFVSSPTLITNKEAHASAQSLLTINTGFFDPQNQKTISYIVYFLPIPRLLLNRKETLDCSPTVLFIVQG